MVKRKKKFKYEGQFAGIEFKLMESEAFDGQSVYAKWLYIEYKHKYNGENDHNIIFTYQDAKKKMAISTFIKSRNQLIERGFIDVIRRGGLEKQPTIYGLSDRWKKFGTKDFIRVDLKKIFPRIITQRFKKRHKFLGNQFEEIVHL
ncbi:unnamed protein product [marine sediment metagenome]|uniref:Uncharacterized protein n=1 Tax=marine sediment metagenome TaxID=412755 RepID=X1RA14_9ZZZZ